MILVLILVVCFVPDTQRHKTHEDSREKFRRIDILGGVLLASTVISFLCTIKVASTFMSLTSKMVWGCAGLSALLAIAFVLVETYYAIEPIYPLRLLANRNVVISYLVSALTAIAQITVSFPQTHTIPSTQDQEKRKRRKMEDG